MARPDSESFTPQHSSGRLALLDPNRKPQEIDSRNKTHNDWYQGPREMGATHRGDGDAGYGSGGSALRTAAWLKLLGLRGSAFGPVALSPDIGIEFLEGLRLDCLPAQSHA